MNHRAGFINGEGDGVGIHIDIPRALWKKKLEAENINSSIVDQNNFIVGHLFLSARASANDLKAEVKEKLLQHGVSFVFETDQSYCSDALGPIAIQENPVFWQFACTTNLQQQNEISALLFELTPNIEQNEQIHVASLSQYHAVYKVMGAGDILPKYYPDLADPIAASTMTLGHNRFSTNTQSSFFRVQPFGVLGHNGEINTIAKLRDEAKMINIPLVKDGSDSQDLSRIIETFICRHGYSLFEALDLIFPPILNEIKVYPDHLKNLYAYMTRSLGSFCPRSCSHYFSIRR